jgi:hypothetical protein
MNPFPIIGHYLANFLKALAGKLGASVKQYLDSFVKERLGTLAVDAVNYVEATLQGATGVQKRDAAVDKLTQDATAAGIDLTGYAKSTLIFLVETAVQAVLSGVVAKL